jgi:hypothetical protein
VAAEVGAAFRIALRQFAEARQVPTAVPAAKFDKMVASLERGAGGPGGAAAAAGVTPRTWNAWKKGTRRPSAASQAKVKTAYEDRRRPGIAKLRRSLAAKKALRKVRVQISGTVAISRTSSVRSNFAEEDLRTVDLSGAWRIRNDPAKLKDFFTAAVQEATGLDCTFPEPDVTIVLVA